MQDPARFVLVVGGSGYLGLHILRAICLDSEFRTAFTYFSNPPPPQLFNALPNVHAFKVDLRSGEGLADISQILGPPRIVINCAAISIPRECESDPANAVATNIPYSIVRWISSFDPENPPLLIHLSTDQVYDGSKSFYKEDDETKPVNVYGRSKLEAEQFIKERWSNYAILRSSIIYGPQPIIPVRKSLPIQWIHGVLTNGGGAEFFHDEYRCPIFVDDVVDVVLRIIAKEHQGAKLQLLLNVGGPSRLSRAEIAEAVADINGIDKSLIRLVSASSINRGVRSPADISMDVSKCISELNVKLTPFHQGVVLTLL